MNTTFTVAKTPLANQAGRVILRSPGKGGTSHSIRNLLNSSSLFKKLRTGCFVSLNHVARFTVRIKSDDLSYVSFASGT